MAATGGRFARFESVAGRRAICITATYGLKEHGECRGGRCGGGVEKIGVVWGCKCLAMTASVWQ